MNLFLSYGALLSRFFDIRRKSSESVYESEAALHLLFEKVFEMYVAIVLDYENNSYSCKYKLQL